MTTATGTTSAPLATTGGRRLMAFFHRHRRLQLALLLALPLGWLVVVYLGSLAVLFVSSFWSLDPLTSAIDRSFTLENYQKILTQPVYRVIVLRTVTVAAAVTLTDVVLAFPIAYYMARVASRRTRGVLLLLVALPLWSSYLVRVYAWRVILGDNGPLDWVLGAVGLGGVAPGYSDLSMWITFSYLWLPYMILPLYAGFQRLPTSLLEASSDLGAHGALTFRRVVLPLVMPAVVAGSIFTFSLTLGDYIIPQIIGNSASFIGMAVYQLQGTAGNIPLAAAFAMVPIVIMMVYLTIARRLGAFDAL
jgi:putative spermidine/putrescine transport system permease protein